MFKDSISMILMIRHNLRRNLTYILPVLSLLLLVFTIDQFVGSVRATGIWKRTYTDSERNRALPTMTTSSTHLLQSHNIKTTEKKAKQGQQEKQGMKSQYLFVNRNSEGVPVNVYTYHEFVVGVITDVVFTL